MSAVATADTLDAVASAELHAGLDPDGSRRRELVWQDPVASFGQAAGLSGLDYMRAIMAAEIPPPPIAVLMRITPIAAEEGLVRFEGHPAEEHYNPIGVVHGGYAATLLDSAMGSAVQTTLPPRAGYATLGLELKLLRPITRETGPVVASGEVVHRGRRQATAEGRISARDDGRLLAHGTTTCMILGSGG
jgi:uncharacterized protein (TIGR00369 family)